MGNKTYIRQTRRKFSTKYIGDAFVKENRRTFQEWGAEVAKGYNRIVSGWSSESKPQFVPRIRYQTETMRFFVYIDIKGTSIQVQRFEGIDFGAERDTKVELGTYEAFTDTPLIPTPRPKRAPKDIGATYRQKAEYDKMVTKIRKQNLAIVAGNKEAALSPPRQKRAPMREHFPRTGKGAQFGGPGVYHGARAFANEWTMGDIEARGFTIALHVMAATGTATQGGTDIWDVKKVYWRNTVRRAYARGVRAANRVARAGAG